MKSRLFPAAVVFVLLCALHLFLYSRLPEGRTDNGWACNVLHNWHEYGYWQLNGQLVSNPGGLEPGETPYVYPGHRPAVLIIPYLLKELPRAIFGNGLLYDFAVLAMTYAALLRLFGPNWRGLLIASATCLAPGFFNNVSGVDTISVPALLGIAVLAFVCQVLTDDKGGWPLRIGAIVILVLYMMLNWSTLFSLGVGMVYVFCRCKDLKKTAANFAVALAVGLGVLVISMHSRHAGVSNSGDFWNSYLWGPLGYDRSGMNFSKAFVRIMAVNAIAWFPLVAAGLGALLINGRGQRWKYAVWPLLAGIGAVFTLRNYNAHHPWNAVSEIGLGLIFSLELLVAPENRVLGIRRTVLTAAVVAFSTVSLIGWLALDEFNGRDHESVHALVVDHTPRHALIVVADGLLPVAVPDLTPFQEEFDRKLISLDQWNREKDAPSGPREIFLLAHTTTVPGATFVAGSTLKPTWADSIMVPLFDFYRNKISRRAAGNRKEYYDSYQLYKF